MIGGGVLVLGIDPALCNTGWAVCRLQLEGRGGRVSVSVEACGVVSPRTPKDERLQAGKDAKRVGKIARKIGELLRAHSPAAIASEGPGGSQRARSAATSALAWGCVVGLATDHSVPVSIVSPHELKVEATGKGTASKAQVADAMLRFALWTDPGMADMQALADGKREHAFDAVAAVWALRRDRALLAAMRAGG